MLEISQGIERRIFREISGGLDFQNKNRPQNLGEPNRPKIF
jgi:hypothetical protein